MRQAEICRRTAETDIRVKLTLEGDGSSVIDTGVGFLDHMLTLFARHGRFDLEVTCRGDTCVDDHHSVEDIGIALGKAFGQALGDRKGIVRYGQTILTRTAPAARYNEREDKRQQKKICGQHGEQTFFSADSLHILQKASFS